MKKILIISPIPTHPNSEGCRIRIYNMCEQLKNMGHDVYFLYIDYSKGDTSKMREYWEDHLILYKYNNSLNLNTMMLKVKNKMRQIRWKCNFLVDFFRFKYKIDEMYDEGLNNFVREIMRQHNFDIVIVEYVFFSKALEVVGEKVLKIIDTHDVFTDREKLYINNKERPSIFYTSLKEEKKGLNRADIIFAIQGNEADWFRKVTNKKVFTIGHSVTVKNICKSKRESNILFVGSGNSINQHAINYFITNIMPLIKKEIIDAKLLICGSICKYVEVNEDIIKLGVLENVEEAYRLADIAINPIQFGTGLKIKTIEVLGYGIPLVVTPIGAEGLEEAIDNAFLVGNSAQDFSNKIVRILSNSELHKRISDNACKYAEVWNRKIYTSLNEAIKK